MLRRPLGASLRVLWLAALGCAFAAPVALFGTARQATVEHDVRQLAREASVIRWLALADAIVLDGDSDGARVHALQQLARAGAGGVPGLRTATEHIRAADAAERLAPSATTREALANAVSLADANVADESGLTFESQVVVCNLGDALSVSYVGLIAPLDSAAAIASADASHRRIAIDERLRLAGHLAVARNYGAALDVDMNEAFAYAAAVRPELRHAWGTARASIGRLESQLDPVAQHGVRGPASLALRRAAVRTAGDALLPALRDALLDTVGDVSERERAGALVADRWEAVAIALVFAAAAWTLLLIRRRARSERARADQESRAVAAERARMLTEAQFDAVFDRSQIGIALLDADGAIVECNSALCAMLGTCSATIVAPDDARFSALLDGQAGTYQYEEAWNRADAAGWAQITISPIDADRADAVRAIAMVQDITERRALDERLRYDAAHDALTALFNRTEFLARLEDVLADAAAAPTRAVLFVDLDRLKLINDTLGHPAGDRAIALAGRRLVAATREEDIVARLHGDEFAVLLSSAPTVAEAQLVAERINAELLAPIEIDGTPIVLSASVGIVVGLERYRAAEYVMRDADIAMYDAKRRGRSTAVVFDDSMNERLNAQVRILADVRFAGARDELHVTYQPVVDLSTSVTVGFEALMRWTHPTLGPVSPVTFIPAAEESDAIHDIGRYALRAACATLRRLDGIGAPPMRANVNLAVAQFQTGDVVRDVREALAAAQLEPRRLTLEITESGLLENTVRARAVLSSLHALGVKLCIDDFGTGYSSLRYLHEFTIDVLKIDKSFVHGSSGRLANPPIVQMLLTLAHHLDVGVVAEGIETEPQREALVELGCHAGQGYLFARPLPENELCAWLQQRGELGPLPLAAKAASARPGTPDDGLEPVAVVR